jgi:hypothetical protein
MNALHDGPAGSTANTEDGYGPTLPPQRMNNGQRVHQFESGAVRANHLSEHARYDLIDPIEIRRLAETYAEGAKKYGANNWKKGFPAEDLFAHAMVHLQLYAEGDNSEDHLGHAMWNIGKLMVFEETRPELFRNMPQREQLGSNFDAVKKYPRWWEKDKPITPVAMQESIQQFEESVRASRARRCPPGRPCSINAADQNGTVHFTGLTREQVTRLHKLLEMMQAANDRRQ